MSVSLHPMLMDKTAFHTDTLARVGLSKSFNEYVTQPYLSDCDHDQASQLQQSPFMALEFFALLKSQKDVFAEYSGYEQLKRMRQAYILHVLDVILTERSRVAANDQAIAAEEVQGPKVGLDNVFKLAAGHSSDEESESSDEEEDLAETLPATDLCQAALPATATADRRDQGLVRPKVLILAPFKQMAFQIIEQVIMLCNGGKWKKISKKKKFKQEYDNEEEAFSDFFRIGLSFLTNKKTGKL